MLVSRELQICACTWRMEESKPELFNSGSAVQICNRKKKQYKEEVMKHDKLHTWYYQMRLLFVLILGLFVLSACVSGGQSTSPSAGRTANPSAQRPAQCAPPDPTHPTPP